MAALAAGMELPEHGTPFPPPAKLVRQTNRLSWFHELQCQGYSVVSPWVVQAFDSNIVVNGEEITCPADHVILVNPGMLVPDSQFD